jgi:3-deoxy-7-phosphoheptulonate synthase
MQVGEDQLPFRYQSFCDPRLNFEQSLGMRLRNSAYGSTNLLQDVAFLISEHMQKERRGAIGASDILYSALGGMTK